jgi:xanthine dehydrogenase accessory factor
MRDFIQQLKDQLTALGSVKTCVALTGRLKGKHLIWEGDKSLYFDEEQDLWKELLPGLKEALPCTITELEGNQYFIEKLTSAPKLIILGGGHISAPLAMIGKLLGFEVTVIDDRPEFASRERFPNADHLTCADYNQAFEALPEYANSYYVVVTPGHKKDLQCVLQILNRSYAYVGMIGSRTKVAKVHRTLQEMGYPKETLKELHAPIGLMLGGQTPAEIAVSIAAELVQERNLVPTSVIEEEIWQGVLEGKGPMVLAEIISKTGSSPRGNGSRMLVLEGGSIRGTIGGGSVENAAIQKSLSMLASGETFAVEEYILSDAEGATLGMVCGGNIKVMFEQVTV